MALYDDKWWLLSHIQHSFVFSDDTGNSELVMTARDGHIINQRCRQKAREEGTEAFLDPLLLLDEGDEFDGAAAAAHSFEIRPGGRHGYPRPRCNTEIKLEKLKRDKKNLPKVKTINFKENPLPLSPEELEQLFPRKEISAR